MNKITSTVVRAWIPSRALMVAGLDGPNGDVATDAGPIVVRGQAVPYNVAARMNFWGDTIELAPGSLHAGVPGRVKFLLDHRNKPFGFGASFTDTATGLDATLAVPRDELADPEIATAVRQMGNGVRDALSIGFVIEDADETYDKAADRFHYRVTAGELVEVSSCVIPMFADARHQPVAASRRLMLADDTTTEPDETEPDETEPTEPDETEGETMDATATATIDDTARAAAHRATIQATTTAGRAARYPSFGAYARAKFDAGAGFDPGFERLVQAAWTDETTADIRGIVPEQWVRELIDLMGAVTPTVQAFSQRPLPAAGMVVNEPRVDQGPDVGVQTTEKTEIASRKVLISPVPFPVLTYAGGQDISIQALLRSDPSYFDELMRLFAREMAVQIEGDAAAAVLTGATNATPITPTTLNDAFVDASAAVLARTFQLPTVTVLGVDLWVAMGKAVDQAGRPLFPGVSPANPIGSFDLTDTSGQVRGLAYFVSPAMDPTKGVVGIPDAFRTRLGSIGTLTADVPQKLGRDVAVYRFATMGVTDARGLQELDYTATVARRASSS